MVLPSQNQVREKTPIETLREVGMPATRRLTFLLQMNLEFLAWQWEAALEWWQLSLFGMAGIHVFWASQISYQYGGGNNGTDSYWPKPWQATTFSFSSQNSSKKWRVGKFWIRHVIAFFNWTGLSLHNWKWGIQMEIMDSVHRHCYRTWKGNSAEHDWKHWFEGKFFSYMHSLNWESHKLVTGWWL